MTIKPRSVDQGARYEDDQRDRVVRPLRGYTSSPLFEGWGPKL